MLPPAPIIPTYKKSSGLEGLWPHYRESIEKSLFEIQKDLKNKKIILRNVGLLTLCALLHAHKPLTATELWKTLNTIMMHRDIPGISSMQRALNYFIKHGLVIRTIKNNRTFEYSLLREIKSTYDIYFINILTGQRAKCFDETINKALCMKINTLEEKFKKIEINIYV